MAYLVLVRHTQSQWNAKGLWTGLTDISLSESGREKARFLCKKLKDIHFDRAFTSVLKRSKETLKEIKTALGGNFPITEDKALNERDYGEFTGKNKWQIKEEVGDEEFLKIRRGFDHPIPGGETLKDVFNRVVPYYQAQILPYLKNGKNVLIVAHGNSLRALVKYLENISDADISGLEIETGEILIYEIDKTGNIATKAKRG